MKVAAATTLLFSALALASPAPAPAPDAVPATLSEFRDALAVRDANLAARVAAPQLDARASKPKGGSSGNATSAAVSITPSGTLQLAVLGFGIMEVLRLWN